MIAYRTYGPGAQTLLRLMLGTLLLILPAALVGCAGPCPPRADVAEHPQPVYVDRVVPTACIEAKAMPAAPPPIGQLLTGDARHDAAILASALLRERAVRDQSMALLTGCAK